MFSITLPYPPSTNTYWRNVNGKTLISAKGRDYKKTVSALVLVNRIKTLTKPLIVVIDAWMPDNRKRDVDNLLKSSLDSLTAAGVWLDDSQIIDLRIIRRGVEKPGQIIVTIRETIDTSMEPIKCQD